jgi:hypothetical protein
LRPSGQLRPGKELWQDHPIQTFWTKSRNFSFCWLKRHLTGTASLPAVTMHSICSNNSAWNTTTTRHHASWLSDSFLLSSHGATLSSTRRASLLLHHLSLCSHCAALLSSCHASWLSHCLSPSSRCATLSSTRHASLLSHHLSSSSRCAPCHPLVLSSRRLVVASPLDAPPSCRLIASSCHLSLSRRTSWLLHHHLLSSSCCTALSSSHRAGWLLRCLSLHRPLVLLS